MAYTNLKRFLYDESILGGHIATCISQWLLLCLTQFNWCLWCTQYVGEQSKQSDTGPGDKSQQKII